MGEYEVDGESCWFVSQERMVKGVDNNEFLDVGEHDSYMFGTTFAAVREVMAENKLCIIDCRPEVGTNYLPTYLDCIKIGRGGPPAKKYFRDYKYAGCG